MSELKMNTIYDAHVVVNGNSTLGQIEELTVPGIKPKFVEHKGLGIASTVDIPSGFDKMEFKAKWNSLYETALKEFADIYRDHTVIIFGNVQKWEGDALAGEVPAVLTVRGKSKGTPDVTIKHQDNPELEKMISPSMVTFEVNGEEIYHLDILANEYRVGGEDKWAQRRQNLGLQ